MRRAVGMALVLAGLLWGSAQPANALPTLITNGTFNSPSTGPVAEEDWDAGRSRPGTCLNHWCKLGGGCGISTAHCLNGVHPSCGNWVELGSTGCNTGLRQDIHFCKGTAYTLSFCLEAPCMPVGHRYNVGIETCDCELTCAPGNPGPQNHCCPGPPPPCNFYNAAFSCDLAGDHFVSYSFVAPNCHCGYIQIIGNDQPGNAPLGVGNIQLVAAAAAAPEVSAPAAGAAVGLALGLLALVESRRRR